MCGASARGLNRAGELCNYHFICGKMQIADIQGMFLVSGVNMLSFVDKLIFFMCILL